MWITQADCGKRFVVECGHDLGKKRGAEMQRETDPGPASQPINFRTEWANRKDLPRFKPLPGIEMEVFSGGRAMMNFVIIEPGGIVGWHSHPHEQCGTVIAGEIHLRVGTEDAEP